jgi:hypothetical protein
MSKATKFDTLQSQVVQLEVQFKAPLTKGQQVELILDLITFNVVLNYDYRLVFVNESTSFYYLKPNMDGSLISHWVKQTSSTIIDKYDATKPYTLGSIVHLNQKIYQAITNTVAGTLKNINFWSVITGEQQTNRILLTGVSSIVLYTEIKNPIFEVIECTFDVSVLDTDGQVQLINPIYGEASYERTTDLPDNGGQAYTITFEEDELPFLFTGVVNIR